LPVQYVHMSPYQHPADLRNTLRQARRQLSPATRLANELAICNQLDSLPELKRARRLGLYQSEDGEVDLTPLQCALLPRPVAWFLPVLRPGRENRLWFAPYRPGDPLRLNRFGIEEPDSRHRPPVSLRSLDLVLMPLVGFDASLNRLGMGGGFYDRSFAFLRHARWRRPRLIGIAHGCQRVEQLYPQPWDLPLDAVVTETGVYR
jgi:5-formyltetrahydrofolate cyclo-ligase